MSTQVLVLSSEGNFDPQRLALESGTLLLGPMEEAQHLPLRDHTTLVKASQITLLRIYLVMSQGLVWCMSEVDLVQAKLEPCNEIRNI